MYVCMHACAYVFMCAFVFTHAHTHTHTRTHTHKHTHTGTLDDPLVLPMCRLLGLWFLEVDSDVYTQKLCAALPVCVLWLCVCVCVCVHIYRYIPKII
jgi:hypothetical protein